MLLYNCPLGQRDREKKLKVCVCRRKAARKEDVKMEKKKYCVKCGKQFQTLGREVICPSCKAQATEESKRAAVLRAKRASWTGESVPVRIGGRASTLIRKYGAAHDLPFAAALDELLKSTSFFVSLGVEWSTITPYKSHRRDKHATETESTTEQDVQGSTQAAGKAASKPSTSKAAGKAVKTSKASK